MIYVRCAATASTDSICHHARNVWLRRRTIETQWLWRGDEISIGCSPAERNPPLITKENVLMAVALQTRRWRQSRLPVWPVAQDSPGDRAPRRVVVWSPINATAPAWCTFGAKARAHHAAPYMSRKNTRRVNCFSGSKRAASDYRWRKTWHAE